MPSVLTPDLDAYFARIGYSGPRTPTLETLRALQWHHVLAVPFENLDVLLGRRISMDPAAIAQKIVTQHRGGYCFEQNSLFRDVLRALGFQVTPLLGRVRWQIPADVATPLTHMLLRVDIDGRPWLADVGFGSASLPAPLALDTDAEQATPMEPRRIVRSGPTLTHQIRLGDTWTDVYRFSLDEPAPIDFEVGNWFSCTHPTAHFLNTLVVTRLRPNRRIVIFNRELTFRARDGSAERRDIASRAELLALLAEHFDLHFPAGTRFGPPGFLWPQ